MWEPGSTFLRYHLPAVAWVAVVTWVLFLPGEMVERTLEAVPWVQALPGADKVGHFVLFLVLAWLTHRSFSRLAAHGRALAWSLLACLLFAAFTESVQLVVPGRTGSVVDFLADAAGAGLYGLAWKRFGPRAQPQNRSGRHGGRPLQSGGSVATRGGTDPRSTTHGRLSFRATCKTPRGG